MNLPSGTGRDVRVAVIAKAAKAAEAKAAGDPSRHEEQVLGEIGSKIPWLRSLVRYFTD